MNIRAFALLLIFSLTLFLTASSALAKSHSNQDQMLSEAASSLPAPELQGQAAKSDQSEPFNLNASKNDENNRIPRTRAPFELNATRFHNGVQQEQQPDPQFGADAPKFDVSAFQQEPLSGKVQQQAPLSGSAQAVRLLANYDIELLVDQSMSMRRIDCPYGVSRWNWCGMQANELAKQLSPFVKNGFTMTTFAGGYHVYRNATPTMVMDLFMNPRFSSGTRMAEPLEDRIENHFAQQAKGGKPLLLAVITDGVPSPKREPFMVADVLVNATKRMRDPRDITIVFFQIGTTDVMGRMFLDFLDNHLMASGAKYDIVRNVPMERLMQVGLGQALVDSIHEANNRISPAAEQATRPAVGNPFYENMGRR